MCIFINTCLNCLKSYYFISLVGNTGYAQTLKKQEIRTMNIYDTKIRANSGM